jgi:hypothetical protein
MSPLSAVRRITEQLAAILSAVTMPNTKFCPLQWRREEVRDGEGVKKNKLIRDPQVPASEHQRVPVEACCEQSTLSLDIGLKNDK